MENCLYDGLQGNSTMTRCCQCMKWVHLKCCGDDEDIPGVYNCSLCRNMYLKLTNLEKQIDQLHEVNNNLVKLLENSQQECSSLRSLIEILINEKEKTPVKIGNTKLNSRSPLKTELRKATSQTSTKEQEPKPRPVPAPRKTKVKSTLGSSKPNLTLIGDSMIRGTGKVLSANLNEINSCVLSKSGLKLDQASKSIKNIVEDHKACDFLAIQLGTNDVDALSPVAVCSKYGRIIENVNRISPRTKVIVTALPNHINAGSGDFNLKMDVINENLRTMCSKNSQCLFKDCNPPLLRDFYKYDGFHFNLKGTSFMACRLAEAIDKYSNFHIPVENSII